MTPSKNQPNAALERKDLGERSRLRLTLRGTVQGVGFRPFVYRLANELKLAGLVSNSTTGVLIEVEGDQSALAAFRERLADEKPSISRFDICDTQVLPSVGETSFRIETSDSAGDRRAVILPDLVLCDDCRRELLDPNNRRFRYPFINCTNCGPRYSIVESLPYDRRNTTMRGFAMCESCRMEYDNPADRRFHAQPNACPVCGPQLSLWDSRGAVLTERDTALREAAARIRQGEVLAVKGLGGFHLMVDARNGAAVAELRRRKHREEKPLAVMFPDLSSIERCCELSADESALLQSTASPIVLLRRRPTGEIDEQVAPENPYLGAILPYTPLHLLLLQAVGHPVVATSGNLSEEPICIDEHEALKRLGGIAGCFLVHNRPIARHVDDSIARVTSEGVTILRRARGYAPLPIRLPAASPRVLAVGAHLKNSVAVAVGDELFVSQHIGDLETPPAYRAFEKTAGHLRSLYDQPPEAVACDLHPDYLSTQYARKQPARVVQVQHHYAHVLSCMAEHGLEPPVMGVSWDGTGYGPDGTVWGGEFLLVDDTGYERVASLRPFRLPGGDAAVREPRRSALGVLHEVSGPNLLDRIELPTLCAFSQEELALLWQMLAKGVNASWTTSAGRLFDTAASLLGLRQVSTFEGQAAMALQFAAEKCYTEEKYPTYLANDADSGLVRIDWGPMIEGMVQDIGNGLRPELIASRFHNSLASAIVDVARTVACERVVLSGGCFQNVLLLERSMNLLRQAGFRPYCHREIPTNDGGIAVGQAIAAMRVLRYNTEAR